MKKRVTSLLLIFSFLFAFAPLCTMGVSAADSWQPVFRYLHISDEHITASAPTGTPTSTGTQISGVVRAAKAIADRDGVPISAVTAGGDQLSAAYPNEYAALAARFGEIHDLMEEEFPILAVLGNHDYNNGYFAKSDSVAKKYAYIWNEYPHGNRAEILASYRSVFVDHLVKTGAVQNNEGVHYHKVVGGFHMIGISIDDYDGNLSRETLSFLSAALRTARKDAPGKPIFVNCHYPIYGTTTSSTDEGCAVPNSGDLSALLDSYPEVILATGHTHCSANVPMAVWQSPKGWGTVSTNTLQAGEFFMVEVDKNNTVRYIPYILSGGSAVPMKDYRGGTLFYEFRYGSDGTPTPTYTDAIRTAQTPAFPDQISIELLSLTEAGNMITAVLRFPQATAGEVPAASFTLSFQPDDGSAPYVAEVVSHIYESSRSDMVYASGILLKPGKTYALTVTPKSYFGTAGKPKTLSFDTPAKEENFLPYSLKTSYAHQPGGTNFPLYDKKTGIITYLENWEIGIYHDGILPLSFVNENGLGLIGKDQSAWTYGGNHFEVGNSTVCPKDGYGSVYEGYRAPVSGILSFSAWGLRGYTEAGKEGTLHYAVVNLTTGEILYPANATSSFTGEYRAEDDANWATLAAGEAMAKITLSEVRINRGDVIAVVTDLGTQKSWGGTGLCMEAAYHAELLDIGFLRESTFIAKPGESGFPATDGKGNAVYPNAAWTCGRLNAEGEYLPFLSANETYQYFTVGTPKDASIWSYGGIYWNKRSDATVANIVPFILPGKDASVAVVYTAEETGYADITLLDLKFEDAGQKFTVVKNFRENLAVVGSFSPTGYADAWITAGGARTPYGMVLKDVFLHRGDTIAVVFNRGDSNTGWGPYDFSVSVGYTFLADGGSAAADVIPDLYRESSGNSIDAKDFGTEWDVVAYPSKADIEKQEPTKDVWCSVGAQASYWGAAGALALKSGSPAGYRYTVKKDGGLILRFSEVSQVEKTYDQPVSMTVGYAIFRNGEKVFPTGDDWYSITYEAHVNRAKNLAAELNRALPYGISAKKGDKIEVLACIESGGASRYDGSGQIFFASIGYPAPTYEADFVRKAVEDPTGAFPWSAVGYENEAAIAGGTGVTPGKAANGCFAAGGTGADTALYLLSDGTKTDTYGARGAFALRSGAPAGWRYTAPRSGKVTLDCEGFGRNFTAGMQTDLRVHYAVYLNGVRLSEVVPLDYTQKSRDVVYSFNRLQIGDIYLAKGDRLEVLCTVDTTDVTPADGVGFFFFPSATYRSAPNLASAALGEDFAVKFYPTAEGEEFSDFRIGDTAVTATRGEGENGTFYRIGGIYADRMTAEISYTVRAADTRYTRKDGVTVTIPHAKTEERRSTTFAALMMAYVEAYRSASDATGIAIYDAALSTLFYGGAAQTYFGTDADHRADDALSDEDMLHFEKIGAQDCYSHEEKEGKRFTFRTASLLLRDGIFLKLTLTAENPDDLFTDFRLSDGTGTLYVPTVSADGENLVVLVPLTPTEYGTARTYRLLGKDAEGNYTLPISGTLIYSVVSYTLRMSQADRMEELTLAISLLGEAMERHFAATTPRG